MAILRKYSHHTDYSFGNASNEQLLIRGTLQKHSTFCTCNFNYFSYYLEVKGNTSFWGRYILSQSQSSKHNISQKGLAQKLQHLKQWCKWCFLHHCNSIFFLVTVSVTTMIYCTLPHWTSLVTKQKYFQSIYELKSVYLRFVVIQWQFSPFSFRDSFNLKIEILFVKKSNK